MANFVDIYGANKETPEQKEARLQFEARVLFLANKFGVKPCPKDSLLTFCFNVGEPGTEGDSYDAMEIFEEMERIP